jgi:hypothetical protein
MGRSTPWCWIAVLALAACGGSGGGEADVPAGDAPAVDVGYEAGLEDGEEATPEALADGEEVVCVPADSPNAFSDPCDGTIVDKNTQLAWQKEPTLETFANGKARCTELDLAGADDWRLPTIDELRGVILGCDKTRPAGVCGVHEGCWSQEDLKCWSATGPCFFACDQAKGPGPDGCYLDGLFPQPCQNYWSSTQAKMTGLSEKKAWTVSFVDASISPAPQDSDAFVRCVRGP